MYWTYEIQKYDKLMKKTLARSEKTSIMRCFPEAIQETSEGNRFTSLKKSLKKRLTD
jgi:hypothetical protein